MTVEQGLTVTASFPSRAEADEAIARLVAAGTPREAILAATEASPGAETARQETRVMWRVALVVVFWSIIGTAVGVAFGVVLALTIGPPGTEGIIIQAVSWAIFAHLIIGMCAGYLLLADRSERELGRARSLPGGAVTITVRASGDAEAARIRALLAQ